VDGTRQGNQAQISTFNIFWGEMYEHAIGAIP
jgi:hypothetical protein